MFSGTDRFNLSLGDMPARVVQHDAAVEQFVREQFGVGFSQWCGSSGRRLDDGEPLLLAEEDVVGEMARSVAHSGEAEIIAEEDGVVTVAIPLQSEERDSLVAIRDFKTRELSPAELERIADRADTNLADVESWEAAETIWPLPPLQRLARASRRLHVSQHEAARFRSEAEASSITLSRSYEEISLLYAITQHLRLSNSELELGDLALSWLLECLPAEAVAMVYLPENEPHTPTQPCEGLKIRVQGGCQVTAEQLLEMVEHLELNEVSGPHVATTAVTSAGDWPLPQIRQLLIAPKLGDSQLYGWIAAINHTDGDEFDSTAASLLNTVCSILGTHCGNHELYRRQSSFLAAVVRSLTSAIDAKDPYTSGHSNRVARIAVRLGQELGCDEDEVNTLYMGGLLHDIGKIGIDDNVLRKPGRLTDEEFAHIKQHPELGFRILEDIREFADVLPIVLHHHEQWDGGGYPHGLSGERIPYLARITAVSDSFDAMTSDRTYREGMPVERVEEIFRGGSGSQWDASVIRAYFACRDEILEIAKHEDPEPLMNAAGRQ